MYRVVVLLVAVLSASVVVADPIMGRWQTVKDDNGYWGVIEMKPCGDMICGTLLRSYNDKGEVFISEFDGRNIITETVATGDGSYRGRAFSPDRRRTYNARLRVTGDRLNVRGCILGFCRDGGTWQRLR